MEHNNNIVEASVTNYSCFSNKPITNGAVGASDDETMKMDAGGSSYANNSKRIGLSRWLSNYHSLLNNWSASSAKYALHSLEPDLELKLAAPNSL